MGSSSEFPDPQEFPAETVVLDLPYRVRWAAFQQLRERYSGRMIVTVSSERETEGWPPDPACWFLVRPFGADDVLRALRAPVPPAPAAIRRRHPAGREAAPPRRAITTEAPDSKAAPEPASRHSSEESLWDVDTGSPAPPVVTEATVAPAVVTPIPTAEPAAAPPVVPAPSPVVGDSPAEPEDEDAAPPSLVPLRVRAALDGLRRPSRRGLAEVVGALVLVVVTGLGGIAIGRASASPDRIDVSAIHSTLRPSATSQASPPATGKEVLASAASCLSALDRSDAAISYLVGNIRDERLSRSMQQYQVDRRVCRERVR